jgi:hypothetical protein
LLDVLIRTSAWDTGKTQLRGGISTIKAQGCDVGGWETAEARCVHAERGRGRRERRGEAAPPPPGARGAMREKQRRGHRGSLDLAVAPVTPY